MITVAGHYNLRESMALISMCNGAIATDSGLGHISANLGFNMDLVTTFLSNIPEIISDKINTSAKLVIIRSFDINDREEIQIVKKILK